MRKICPCCGEGSFYIANKKYAFSQSLSNKCSYRCSKCNWRGKRSDLLTHEEFINKKRTDLIERMLR